MVNIVKVLELIDDDDLLIAFQYEFEEILPIPESDEPIRHLSGKVLQDVIRHIRQKV